ncbi:MAG: tryptophan synthase subunit beta, partial [Chloroflexota bacterium]
MGGRRGYFGDFGGRFVPEALVAVLDELEAAYEAAKADPLFWEEFAALGGEYAGRPTPLYYAAGLTER